MSTITVNLKVWRQSGPQAAGRLVDYRAEGVSQDMSFLEMLDVVNDGLIRNGDEPIAFDSDCREGICGACGVMVNGVAHGPEPGGTVCQLHMRRISDGETITIEPWRARAFPVVRDLVVDCSAFDRVIAAGGYVSVNTGSAPEANAIPVARDLAEQAMDSAQCIGCGACVAACKNASAALFTSAKMTHLALLPQGQVERGRRVVRMVGQMDAEGFGMCSNEGECEAVCPKGISIANIAKMNREVLPCERAENRVSSTITASANGGRLERMTCIGSAVLAILTLAQAAPAAPAAPLDQETAKGFLLTAKVTKVKTLSKGVTRPRRVTLTNGTLTHDAVFQAIDESKSIERFPTGRVELDFRDSWHFNIAAFELARAVGLEDMVPPCVSRMIQSERGSLCWWVTWKWGRSRCGSPRRSGRPTRWNGRSSGT